MNNKVFNKFAISTINFLKELARKAKIAYESSEEKFRAYSDGEVMGYYSIITLLKHQAFAFCIDQKELGLADIQPDVDLLGLRRNPEIDFGEDNWAIEEMTEENVKWYLQDSIASLKEQAREAKRDADYPKEGYEDFTKGELMAYYTTFALLKRQALVFNIDEKAIGLADLDLKELCETINGEN